MQFRPFDSDRFLVDIARGDIFAESGDLLIIGRPRGLRAPGYGLDDPASWVRDESLGHRNRRIQRCLRDNTSWNAIFSFPYNPKSRARLPDRPDDLAALHYYLLRNELELFLVQMLRRERICGNATFGLVPISWRKPHVVAHAMIEALAGLFFCAAPARAENLNCSDPVA